MKNKEVFRRIKKQISLLLVASMVLNTDILNCVGVITDARAADYDYKNEASVSDNDDDVFFMDDDIAPRNNVERGFKLLLNDQVVDNSTSIYGTTTFSLWDNEKDIEKITGVTYYVIDKKAGDESEDWVSDEIINVITDATKLKPGSYYIGYSAEDEKGNEEKIDKDYIVNVIKAQLGSVNNLSWDAENDGRAVWEAPVKTAQNAVLDDDISLEYQVELYKGDELVKTDVTTELFYDFADAINSNGYAEYKYQVTAKPVKDSGDDRYIDAEGVKVDSVYSYEDTISPVISEFKIGGDDQADRFVITASDDLAVVKYAITDEAMAPEKDSESWINISELVTDESGNKTIVSDVIDVSGVFYAHVSDANGNTASSDNSISSTVLKINMGDNTDTIVLLGNDKEYTLETLVKGGYDFEGYYYGDNKSNIVEKIIISSEAVDTTVTSKNLTAPAGKNLSLNTNFEKQTYNVKITADKSSMIYSGSSDAITLTATLSNVKLDKGVDADDVSFVWYKKVDDKWVKVGVGENDAADPLINRLQVGQVDDSGEYYVEAIITYKGERLSPVSSSTDSPVAIEIAKAPLGITLNDITISYTDAAPSEAEYTIKEDATTGLMAGDTIEGMLADGSLVIGQGETDYNLLDLAKNKVGIYDLNVGLAQANNYNVTVTKGKLTVERKVCDDFVIYFGEDKATSLDEIYTSSAITPAVQIYDGDIKIDPSEYSISYENNVEASDNTALVKADFNIDGGNYKGIKTITFNIKKNQVIADVKMHRDDKFYTDETAFWTYGEKADAMEPVININVPSAPEYVLYYADATDGKDFNVLKATNKLIKTMPENAGEYYVFAYFKESDNYKEYVTEPAYFKINKRNITITACSHVGDSAWLYDGKTYADDAYTQVGTFAGSDNFKSVDVIGSIVNVGTAVNVITYELTPTTIPGNYNIITEDGVLEIKPIKLTAPSNFAWSDDSSAAGKVVWTKVAQKNLVTEYELKLYRDGNAEPLKSIIVSGEEYDFYEDIINDSKENGVGSYKVTIATCPKNVDGTLWKNYVASEAIVTSVKKTAVVEIKKNNDNIDEAGFLAGQEIVASQMIMIEGQKVEVRAISKPGYEYSAKWVKKLEAYDITFYSTYAHSTYITLNHAYDGVMEIDVSADDMYPSIIEFTASNNEEDEYGNIKYHIRAYDEIGLLGYVLTTTPDAINKDTLSLFTSGNNHYYEADVTASTPGKIYLVIVDTAGNVRVCDDDLVKNVYRIHFENGKADEESDDLYSGTMKDVYKLSGTFITLPENVYTKTGYAFKNWSGESGIFSDGAKYTANMGDVLKAQWTNELYKYTVKYYYMDTDGTYNEASEEKNYSGIYGVTVSSSSSSIALNKVGFSIDTSEGHINSAVLGIDSDPVINVYYKRDEYKITYTYEDINGEKITGSDTYLYDADITIRNIPERNGYTFVGWTIDNFDIENTKQMPAKDLEASGYFAPETVNYVVVNYFQDLPSVTGSVKDNNYTEVLSDTYILNEDYTVNYISEQGNIAKHSLGGAKEVIGFSPYAVSVSYGAPSGSSIPDSIITTDIKAEGIVDKTNVLYFNTYYKRNVYDVELNVWKDKRDSEIENKIYNKKWSVSYGQSMSSDSPADINAMAEYGYAANNKENKWIPSSWVEGDGSLKDEYRSYKLAEYTDFSCGDIPVTMPAGNVTITKEYAKISAAQYKVEFYLESADKGFEDEPTYSMYYYDDIGKSITIGADSTYELNYNDILKNLDSNYAAYSYYDTVSQNMTGVVSDKEEMTLKVYFKRAMVSAHVRYYFVDEGKNREQAENIISYDVTAPWGSTFFVNPAKYFYGAQDAPTDSSGFAITNVNKGSRFGTNFNDELCAISTIGYYWTMKDGGHWPNYVQIETNEELSNHLNVSNTMGQGTDASGHPTYYNIYYTKINVDKTYEMAVTFYDDKKYTVLHETVNDDFTVAYKKDGMNITISNGTDIPVKIANKCDLYNTSNNNIEETESYKVEKVIKREYTYGALKDGYYQATVTRGNKSSDAYVYCEANKSLYIVNDKNSFYAGNYVYFDIENGKEKYCENPLGLCHNQADDLVEEGYSLTRQTNYSMVSNFTTGYTRNWYYYQNPKEKQTVTYVFGSKTGSEVVEYNTVLKLAERSYVSSVFNTDEGYQIVWYEDSSYTKPVNPAGYRIRSATNFYGRREKELITSYDFIFYQKLDNSYLVKADVQEESPAISWIERADKNALEGTGNEYFEEEISRSYFDNQFDRNTDVPYMAKIRHYYQNGILVATRTENKSLSYSTLTLLYNSEHYVLDGFKYDEKDSRNMVRGFVQNDAIDLVAYFHREKYDLSICRPFEKDETKNAYTHAEHLFDEKITVDEPKKIGYRFVNWKFVNKDNDAEIEDVKNVIYDSSKTVTFNMPAVDTVMKPVWEEAPFDYALYSYFQLADGNYGVDKANALFELEAIEENLKAVDVDYLNKTYTGSLIKDGDDIKGVRIYDAEKQASLYFDAEKITCDSSSISVSVNATDILVAKQIKNMTTDTTVKVADTILDFSETGIFGYYYSTYKTDTENKSISKESSFTATPRMVLNNYYYRSVTYKVTTIDKTTDYTKANAEADQIYASTGLIIKGGGEDFYYGQEIELEATVSDGYEFKGWYKASDVLEDYDADAHKPLSEYYIDTVKLETAKKLDCINSKDEHGKLVYTAKVIVEDNEEYVAVNIPFDFSTMHVSVVMSAGNDDYTYGYEDSTNNYLTAKIVMDEMYRDSISVISYQWYEVASKGGVPEEGNKVDGATSATLIIDSGMPAGPHYYKCVVLLRCTTNGRTGVVEPELAYTIDVKKYGAGEGDGIPRYHYGYDYDRVYDGDYHGVDVYVRSSGIHPSKYEIYYSENPIESYEQIVEGLPKQTVFHKDDNSMPEQVMYKDVLVDEEGNVISRKVYYYIHTEEDYLDRNFSDVYGYYDVLIRPVILKLSKTEHSFEKVYDASQIISGADYERFINGEDGNEYYTLTPTNTSYGLETGLTLSCNAVFNNKHVDKANAITISNMCMQDDEGNKSTDYVFADGYFENIPGYITPYELHLEWDSEKSFVYDGDKHAVKANLKEGQPTPPDADVEIVSIGAKVNVGTYKATASLNIEGKSYELSDYKFDIASENYAITQCPITVSPVSDSFEYDGTSKTLSSYMIERDGVTKVVEASGACASLPTDQLVDMEHIGTNKSGLATGNYEVGTKAGSVKIYLNGTDITYDYAVTYGTSNLEITKKAIKIMAVTVNNKPYDAGISGSLKTKTVGSQTVLDGVTLDGVVGTDEVYILASKVTNICFENAEVGNNKSVTFDITADALVGAEASNYTLDVDHSVKTGTADITKKALKVKPVSLSGVVYGDMPEWKVDVSGFAGSDSLESLGIDTSAIEYKVDGISVSDYVKIDSGSNQVTVIPYKNTGYAITLKTDDEGYVVGLSADNYTFVPDYTDNPVINITKRPVTVGAVADHSSISKEYDGKTAVLADINNATEYVFAAADYTDHTGELLVDRSDLDIQFTKAYNSKNVLDAEKVLISNAVLKGNAKDNYVLINSAFELPGNITPKNITVKADDKTIIYGDAVPAYTATATGFVAADGNATQTITLTDVDMSCDYDISVSANRCAKVYVITPVSFADTNYNMISETGTLTVKKKTITAGVKDMTIIYGKDPVPKLFEGTFAGFVEAYGDSVETILTGSLDKFTYALEHSDDTSFDYCYKKDGYVIATTIADGFETDNYKFEASNGHLHVNKQFIAVDGITINTKEYDGNTDAKVNYDDIRFTCYVSGAGKTDHNKTDVLGDKNVLDNLVIKGIYDDKNVGTDKEVALTIALKSGSYLDARYTLLGANVSAAELEENGIHISGAAGTQTKALGNIEKRAIVVLACYDSDETKEGVLAYGEPVDSGKFSLKCINGTSLVAKEKFEDAGIVNPQSKIVNISGVEYNPVSSPVGKYYVKLDDGCVNDTNTNYKVTVISDTVKLSGVSVVPSKLKTPVVSWDQSHPGTITWTKVEKIGQVEVNNYTVSLNKIVGGSNEIIKTETLDKDELASVDFAEIIRNSGVGEYKVTVFANPVFDSTTNPEGNPNVLPSDIGSSTSIYAAKVMLAFDVDDITKDAVKNATSKFVHSIDNSNEYIYITGESIHADATWKNEAGYNTGYSIAQVKYSDGTLIEKSRVDDSAVGSVRLNVQAAFNNASDKAITLKLKKRAATLDASITAIQERTAYDYLPADAPKFKAIAKPKITDNIDASKYEYTYKWQYQKGSSYVDLAGQEGYTGISDEIHVETGFAALRNGAYKLRCVITAIRQDNGEKITLNNVYTSMYIDRASVGEGMAKAVVPDWDYGDTRNAPSLASAVAGYSIPAQIGKAHYYFRPYKDDADTSDYTEWTTINAPMDAGIYQLYATVDDSANYDAFDTKQNITTFEIKKSKLLYRFDKTPYASSMLTMKASKNAPYGLASWPTFFGPKENTNSASNYIIASYELKLYEKVGEGNPDKLIKIYGSDNIKLADGNCTVDVSADMNNAGVYYFTIQAFSDNKDNCEDSDIMTSGEIGVIENLQVLDQDNNNLIIDDETAVSYIYDGRDITLKTSNIAGASYQWYTNSTAIVGATSPEYKIRYVEDTNIYACQITKDGNVYETTHISMTILPREVTINTGTKTFTYDGNVKNNDEWWITDVLGQNSSKVSSSTSANELATGNFINNVSVTGNITYKGTAVNTVDLDNLVVIEKDTAKRLYDATDSTVVSNYIIKISQGTLTCNAAALTIKSGTASRAYDGTALTEYSNDIVGLLNGDVLANIDYTGTITDVLYDADKNVVAVDNTYKNVIIKDTSGIDVTDNYDIDAQYGTLKILPKSVPAADASVSANITNAIRDGRYFDHTGASIVPNVVVNDGVKVLIVSDDYELLLNTSEVEVGAYNIKVLFKGNYSGELILPWDIQDLDDPVITGLEEGHKYCEGAEFTVVDNNLVSVVIAPDDDTVGKIINIGNNRKYRLEGTSDGVDYTVTATDIVGNITIVHVQVFDCHTFVDYVEDSEHLSKTAKCVRCDETDTAAIRWGSVSWNYAYEYHLPGKAEPEVGEQGVEARALYAVVDLYQAENVIASKIVNCADKCNVAGYNTASVAYKFDTYDPGDGDRLIPYYDTAGNPYEYKIVVTPAVDVQGTNTNADYKVKYSNDYTDYPDYGYRASIEYSPDVFELNWDVILEPLAEFDGKQIVPDAVYVKVMFAYSENADNTNTASGYQIISQQANTLGVRCEKTVVDGNNVYSSFYPVWKYLGGNDHLGYYHRIQITGYEYDGIYYDLENHDPVYKSINDKDHEKHTVYFDFENDRPSGTIEYIIPALDMPIVFFDGNEGVDITNMPIVSTNYIMKPAYGLPVSANEIAANIPTRDYYEFLGWFDAPEGGDKVEKIDALDHTTTLYAHWREQMAPEGKIVIGNKTFESLESDIVFDSYFNKKQLANIFATDTNEYGVTESGVDTISYYVSDMQIADLETVSNNWIKGDIVQFADDGKKVVYVKIQDKAGNVTYLSTDGLVIDSVDPVVSGVKANMIYCHPVNVRITDANLLSVSVNGIAMYTSDDNVCEFTLMPNNEVYVIEVLDKAGNVIKLNNIKVNNGHTWLYTGDNTDTVNASCKINACELYEYEKAFVSVEAKSYRYDGNPHIAYRTVSQNFIDLEAGTVEDIKYYSANNEGDIFNGTLLNEKPVEPGHYYASVMIHGNDDADYRAVVPYEIYKGRFETDAVIDPQLPDANIDIDHDTARDALDEAGIVIDEKSNDILVYLEMKVADHDEIIANGDKEKIERLAAANSFAPGLYMDISLWLKVNDEEPLRLRSTGNTRSIDIEMDIPENIKNAPAGYIREYMIARVHDGIAEKLDSTTDIKKGSILFDANRFSTYAICYKDVLIPEDENEGDEEQYVGAVVSLSKSRFKYTGDQIRPKVDVKYYYQEYDESSRRTGKLKKIKLKENVDYVLTYENNIDAGNAKVIVSGIGDYRLDIEKEFFIEKKAATNWKIMRMPELSVSDNNIKDSIIESVRVYDGKRKVDPSEYSVNVEGDLTKPGIVYAVISCNGKNYIGKPKKNKVKVKLIDATGKMDLSMAQISLKQDKIYTYTGKEIKPKITVSVNGVKLKKSSYTVVYDNNIDAGVGRITVYGKKNAYGVSGTIEFNIKPKEISKLKVKKLNKISFRDSISDIKPIVRNGRQLLVKDVDYTMTVEDYDINAIKDALATKKKAVVTVVIRPCVNNKNYIDSTGEGLRKKVYIVPRRINSKVSTSIEGTVKYTENGMQPDVKVLYNDRVLVEGVDYTVKYKLKTKMKNGVIQVTATVKGKGVYDGKKKIKWIMELND